MQAGLWEDSDHIRRFTNLRIQEQIDKALEHLDENDDKKFVVIAHTNESGEWKVSSAIKLGDKFSVSAAVYDNWKNPKGIGFKTDVVFSI